MDRYERHRAVLAEPDRLVVMQVEGADTFNEALGSLAARLAELGTIARRVGIGRVHRDRLIGFHCDLDSVPVALHDEYHRVTSDLLADVLATFSAMKTFANQLALFVRTTFSHEATRGLRFKSFGSLVDSARRDGSGPVANESLRKLLVDRGGEVDAHLAFRDKHAEHPGRLTPRTLRAGESTTVTIREPQSGRPRSPGSPEPFLLPKLRLDPTDGSASLHYFHIVAAEGGGRVMQLGDRLETVGGVDAHFARHGSHMHVFGKPELDEAIPRRAVPSDETETDSPDAYDALNAILELTAALIELSAANSGLHNDP
ncbi:MAG: hypothetical protein IH609_20985 [Dehalococcoidia bacterium]|nr:hypothetical protein [Dehalococcoidia bacterium]